MPPPVTPHRRRGSLVTGLFREGPGYRVWRPNGTDDWLIILTLGGSGRFGHTHGALRTRPGELVALAPSSPHDYRVEPRLAQWDLLWCHVVIRPHWHAWLDWPGPAPGLHRLHPGETALRVQRAFEQAHQTMSGADPDRPNFAMNALERMLLWANRGATRQTRPTWDARVARSMDWMNHHMAEPVTVADAAEAVHLSRSRFSHLFQEQTGQSPRQYLEHQRLERARQLLELTPHSVQAVAERVGYASPFYFSARFKRRYGQSPRAHRRRCDPRALEGFLTHGE